MPKGLSLTLEPETRMMFDENASLLVYGKLVVNAKESPVELTPLRAIKSGKAYLLTAALLP